jgi:hypothetical protein
MVHQNRSSMNLNMNLNNAAFVRKFHGNMYEFNEATTRINGSLHYSENMGSYYAQRGPEGWMVKVGSMIPLLNDSHRNVLNDRMHENPDTIYVVHETLRRSNNNSDFNPQQPVSGESPGAFVSSDGTQSSNIRTNPIPAGGQNVLLGEEIHGEWWKNVPFEHELGYDRTSLLGRDRISNANGESNPERTYLSPGWRNWFPVFGDLQVNLATDKKNIIPAINEIWQFIMRMPFRHEASPLGEVPLVDWNGVDRAGFTGQVLPSGEAYPTTVTSTTHNRATYRQIPTHGAQTRWESNERIGNEPETGATVNLGNTTINSGVNADNTAYPGTGNAAIRSQNHRLNTRQVLTWYRGNIRWLINRFWDTRDGLRFRGQRHLEAHIHTARGFRFTVSDTTRGSNIGPSPNSHKEWGGRRMEINLGVHNNGTLNTTASNNLLNEGGCASFAAGDGIEHNRHGLWFNSTVCPCAIEDHPTDMSPRGNTGRLELWINRLRGAQFDPDDGLCVNGRLQLNIGLSVRNTRRMLRTTGTNHNRRGLRFAEIGAAGRNPGGTRTQSNMNRVPGSLQVWINEARGIQFDRNNDPTANANQDPTINGRVQINIGNTWDDRGSPTTKGRYQGANGTEHNRRGLIFNDGSSNNGATGSGGAFPDNADNIGQLSAWINAYRGIQFDPDNDGTSNNNVQPTINGRLQVNIGRTNPASGSDSGPGAYVAHTRRGLTFRNAPTTGSGTGSYVEGDNNPGRLEVWEDTWSALHYVHESTSNTTHASQNTSNRRTDRMGRLAVNINFGAHRRGLQFWQSDTPNPPYSTLAVTNRLPGQLGLMLADSMSFSQSGQLRLNPNNDDGGVRHGHGINIDIDVEDQGQIRIWNRINNNAGLIFNSSEDLGTTRRDPRSTNNTNGHGSLNGSRDFTSINIGEGLERQGLEFNQVDITNNPRGRGRLGINIGTMTTTPRNAAMTWTNNTRRGLTFNTINEGAWARNAHGGVTATATSLTSNGRMFVWFDPGNSGLMFRRSGDGNVIQGGMNVNNAAAGVDNEGQIRIRLGATEQYSGTGGGPESRTGTESVLHTTGSVMAPAGGQSQSNFGLHIRLGRGLHSEGTANGGIAGCVGIRTGSQPRPSTGATAATVGGNGFTPANAAASSLMVNTTNNNLILSNTAIRLAGAPDCLTGNDLRSEYAPATGTYTLRFDRTYLNTNMGNIITWATGLFTTISSRLEAAWSCTCTGQRSGQACCGCTTQSGRSLIGGFTANPPQMTCFTAPGGGTVQPPVCSCPSMTPPCNCPPIQPGGGCDCTGGGGDMPDTGPGIIHKNSGTNNADVLRTTNVAHNYFEMGGGRATNTYRETGAQGMDRPTAATFNPANDTHPVRIYISRQEPNGTGIHAPRVGDIGFGWP